MAHAPPCTESRGVIDLSIEVPLAPFTLRVDAALAGRVTAILGPSGSGKTSLLETVAGFLPRARGRVALDGQVLQDDARRLRLPPERRRVGYVPQDSGLFPHLSVLGNVKFGAREGDGGRVEGAIDTLGLRPILGRSPAALSGGERQRVALARALASDPRVLLLDEPLASVDVELKERILPYLLRVREEWRVPMLYVTHNVGEALALADQVLVLRDGSVEASGAPSQLVASPSMAREVAAGGIENIFPVRILSHDASAGVTRLRTDSGLDVAVPLSPSRPPGSSATLAIRAEDVLVAVEPIRGLSARNVYEGRISRLDQTGTDVLVGVQVAGGSTWLARLTPGAVRELQLGLDVRVWLAVKSHSARWV
jgi:molybdate transport system ATP-binding protein